MADIIDVLRSKYGINIKEINLIKLYKIESPDITADELEAKLSERREKWEKSVNGANEKFAERDRVHLESVQKYEAILRDPKLRRELFLYHNGKSEKSNGEVTKFVKTFFSLASETKKVDKEDVEFFFDYFPEERKKNKQAILAYLKDEYKLHGYSDKKVEEKEEEEEKEKEKKSSFLVTNLFHKKTLSLLRKCEGHYAVCKETDVIRQKFNVTGTDIYDYLKLGKYSEYDSFQTYIEKFRTEVANVRYDAGAEYVPMVDFVNGIAAVTARDDIRDNFEEFKLILKYSKLTPYMFVLGEMKKSSLNKLYEIAADEYGFRDLNEFLLVYFNLLYDNFGISVQQIRGIMKDAQKSSGKQKVLNVVDEVFGRKRTKKMKPLVKTVHILTYWPIYLLTMLFRFCKLIFDNIKWISIILFAVSSLALFIFSEQIYGYKNIFQYGFHWVNYIEEFMGNLPFHNFFDILIRSIQTVLSNILFYLVPTGLVSIFLWSAVTELHKKLDMVGIDRSFDKIIEAARARTEEKYEDYQEKFLAKRLPGILINIVLTVALILLCVII